MNFAQSRLKNIVDMWRWQLSITKNSAKARMDKLSDDPIQLKQFQIAMDREFEKGSKERLKPLLLKQSYLDTVLKIVAFIPAIIATLLLSALLIISAIPAFASRFALQNSKSKILYISPRVDNSKEHKKGNGPAAVKIMTWNLGLSEAELMNQINNLRPSKERAPFQARKIIKENPTFFGLQEAFASQIVKNQIMNPLAENGYHIAYAAKPKYLHGLNSGLVIGSQYPIEDLSFMGFDGLEGADKHANKGVLVGHVNFEGKRVILANTHLNGGFKGDRFEKTAKRINHVVQARTFIQNYCDEHQGDQVIFLGDFNVSRFTSEFNAAQPDYDIESITQLLEEKEPNSLIYTEITANQQPVPPLINNQDLQPIDQEIKSEWNESGEILGTDVDVEALHFTFVIEDIALRSKELGANKTFNQLVDIVRMSLKDEQIAEKAVSTAIKEAINNTPRKAKTLDHIFVSEGNALDLAQAGYKIKPYLGPMGYISDHAAVLVELKRKLL
ncbi:MAG: hypothetical protein WDZ27_03415 [Waddliaceae bacterium]